ncbi:hypothetical protein AB0P40_05610 [Streptomyces sp. NPDC079189]|uniref:hypothetical protein n=1 Tax=Streptomyces sp. NPDC079189 TaxID=3154514 RepID=UPI003439AF1C
MVSARRTAAVLAGATVPVLAPALAGCRKERAQDGAAVPTAAATVRALTATPTPSAEATRRRPGEGRCPGRGVALTPMAQYPHTTEAEGPRGGRSATTEPTAGRERNGPGPGRRRSGVKAAPPAVRPLRTLSQAPESVLGPKSCEFGE